MRLVIAAVVWGDPAEMILAEQTRRVSNRSLSDLFRRVSMRPATLEALIGTGAVDAFGR